MLSTVIAAAALSAAAGAQAPSEKSHAFVMGMVVDAVTNRPVPGAVVTVTGRPPADRSDLAQPASGTRRVQADAQGRFLLRGLSRGPVIVQASASGYLPGGHGQSRSGAPTQPLQIAGDARIGDLTIRLWPEASLSGRVVDEHGDPVVDVSVLLVRREAGGRLTSPRFASGYAARTDDRGVYRFGNVAPGSYSVSVPSRLTTLPASMVDANKATLAALAAGGSQALSMGANALGAAVRFGDFFVQTSGQGHWGTSNALAGRLPFSIQADGRIAGYPTTFHPDALSPGETRPIALKAGDNRSDVDVQLKPVVMQRLAGTVVGPNGPEPHIAVHVIPAYASGDWLERTHEAGVTPTDARGAFTFPAVPPGDYVVKVWRLPPALGIGTDPLPEEPSVWGEVPVTIGNTPPPSMTIALQTGVTLSGRFEFDGTAKPPRPQQLQSTLAGAFEPPWPLAYTRLLAARVNDRFEFTTQGLPPGRYFADFTSGRFAPEGWYLESATVDGRDLLSTPLVLGGQSAGDIVIRYSDRCSTLSGVVSDANGKPDSTALVVVFPAGYRAWIDNGLPPGAAHTAVATQTGEYVIDVRPGDHLMAVIAADQFESWRTPQAVERLASRATAVSVTRGENRRVDMKTR